MNGLVYHLISGQAFFSGIVLVIVALVTGARPERLWKRTWAVILMMGLLAVVLSTTALPPALYVAACVLTALCIAFRKNAERYRRIQPAAVLVWLICIAAELPYHLMPKPEPVTERAVAVIGDSVTAGIDGDETAETWPSLLAREHGLRVQDISHIGETAASALSRVRSHTIDAPIVVVEIGGNDVLGETSAAQFRTDLNALLSELSAPKRRIVLFELPLPPFFHAYGQIQRQAAQRHGVLLIPKRVFLSVLAGSASTLDSIHLTQAGHQQMADRVWDILRPAFEPTKNTVNASEFH